jgi:hypothetical protein
MVRRTDRFIYFLHDCKDINYVKLYLDKESKVIKLLLLINFFLSDFANQSHFFTWLFFVKGSFFTHIQRFTLFQPFEVISKYTSTLSHNFFDRNNDSMLANFLATLYKFRFFSGAPVIFIPVVFYY